MRKSKIVRWLNDRPKFSSTSSTISSSSNEELNGQPSNEFAASVLVRVKSLEQKLETLTKTVDSKLDILLQKLK